MDLLKNTWLDIAVTAIIGAAVATGNEPLQWIVMVYTPLMLILKIAAFLNRHSPSRIKPKDSGAPPMFYHVLYAVNVAILTFGAMMLDSKWGWVAVCWLLIWILSAAAGTGKKSNPKPSTESES